MDHRQLLRDHSPSCVLGSPFLHREPTELLRAVGGNVRFLDHAQTWAETLGVSPGVLPAFHLAQYAWTGNETKLKKSQINIVNYQLRSTGVGNFNRYIWTSKDEPSKRKTHRGSSFRVCRALTAVLLGALLGALLGVRHDHMVQFGFFYALLFVFVSRCVDSFCQAYKQI